MSNFITPDRHTAYLLPPSISDWLSQDHLARFVVEVIDQLDLSNLTRQYAGRGSRAHHPATLLAILVYGYATGVFSSRRLERATYDSVAFRYIAVNSHPGHDTLAHFRRRFLPELADLFVQVLAMAQEMKLRWARYAWMAPRYTPMPHATARYRLATSTSLKCTSRLRWKSYSQSPSQPPVQTSRMG